MKKLRGIGPYRNLTQSQLMEALNDIEKTIFSGGFVYPSVSGATEATAGFELGTAGNTIATSDTGDSTAWDTVSLGAGGTAVYSTDQAAKGSQSCKIANSLNNTSTLIWTTGIGTLSGTHYGRMYVYLGANPSGDRNIVCYRSGVTNNCFITIRSTGKIAILNGSSVVLVTSTNAINLNGWTRIEWKVVQSTTVGQVEVKIFLTADSSTPTETIASSANMNTGTSSDTFRCGHLTGATGSGAWYIDGIDAGATSYPGPLTVTYSKSGLAASEGKMLGPDVSTFAETGLSKTDNIVLAGADIATHVETGLSKIDNSLASGAREFALGRSGLAISEGKLLGPDVSEYVESGMGISDADVLGGDIHTATKSGLSVSEGVLAGVDAPTLTRSGAPISQPLLSGADAYTAAESGAAASEGVLLGPDATTFLDSGLAISEGKLLGPDAATLARTGMPVSNSDIFGPDTTIYSETGIPISPASAAGPDVATYAETATPISDADLSGPKSITKNTTGLVIISDSKALGTRGFALGRTGLAVSAASLLGPDASTFIESGIPTLDRFTAMVITASGNEITDVVRAAAVQGDGRYNISVTNLCPNGGFESNTTGWGIYSAGGLGTHTITRDATTYKYGTASGKWNCTNGAGGTMGVEISSGRSAATAGVIYTASGWANIVANPNNLTFYLSIVFYDAGGTALAQTDSSAISGSLFFPYKVTATAPANTATVGMRVRVVTAANGNTFTVNFDGMQLEIGSEAHDYVETNGGTATAIQVLDSSFGVWEASTNLCDNGGFETNTTHWSTSFASITRDVTQSKFGSCSGKFATDSSGSTKQAAFSMAWGAGNTYTVSAWVWTDAAGVAAGASCFANIWDGSVDTAGTTKILSTQPQRITVTRTTAGGGNFSIKSNIASVNIWIDGVQAEQKSIATPYIHTDGGTASRSAADLKAPAYLLAKPSMWFACCVRINFPGGDTNQHRFFSWRDTGKLNGYELYYQGNGIHFTSLKEAGASYTTNEGQISYTSSHAAGEIHLLAGCIANGQVTLWVDGVKSTSAQSYGIPPIAISDFAIGTYRPSAAAWSDSDFFWAACGQGVLSDADVATLLALGTVAPTITTLPESAFTTAVFPMDTTAYVGRNGGLMGVDQFTATDSGIVISEAKDSGVEQFTSTETGLVVSEGKSSGPDQYTSVETGAAISEGKSSGVDQYNPVRTGMPVMDRFTAMVITASGNEITDVVRAAALSWGTSQLGGHTDGATVPDGGFFVGRSAANIFRRGQCDTNADWLQRTAGATIVTDATTPAPFSPQSIKCTTNGSGAFQGVQNRTSTGYAIAAGTYCVGSIWFKGVAGQTYSTRVGIINTDASVTTGTITNFVATGSWQQLTPAPVAVAVGKIGDVIYFETYINGTRAESFWVAHTMIESGQQIVAPYVATSGGSTASVPAGLLQAPISCIAEIQGWFAIRLRMGWPSSSSPNVAPIAVEYWNGVNQISLYRSSTTVWKIDARRNSTFSAVSVATSHSAGDYVTLIGYWTNSVIGLSVNGGAFVTAARQGNAGGLMPSTFQIGSRTGSLWIDSDILWFACGVGTLTDADAATLNALGNVTPDKYSTLPEAAMITAVFPMDTTSYSAKNGGLMGADQFTATESGMPISPAVARGADVATLVRTGMPISEAKTLGPDAFTAVESGSATSIFVVSGPDQYTAVEAGKVVSQLVAIGADQITHSESGIVKTDSIVFGSKAVVYSELGLAVIESIISGIDSTTFTESGSIFIDPSLNGTDQFIATETGIVESDASIDGTRNIIANRAGTAEIQLIASGVKTSEFNESGLIEAGTLLDSLVTKYLNRTGTVASQATTGAIDVAIYNRDGTVVSEFVVSAESFPFLWRLIPEAVGVIVKTSTGLAAIITLVDKVTATIENLEPAAITKIEEVTMTVEKDDIWSRVDK